MPSCAYKCTDTSPHNTVCFKGMYLTRLWTQYTGCEQGRNGADRRKDKRNVFF